MRCPYCNVDNDRVVDSRSSDDGSAIRRRRECSSCKERYTTYERLEDVSLKVIKKNGEREPFSREKIRQGLEKACWKRPISADQINNVVNSIENAIRDQNEMEVSSGLLGEMVMERLQQIDQVAFVRFASVYREFKDVRDFVEQVRPMLRGDSRRTQPID